MSERCHQYDEQISAFLDGELTEKEAAALRAHAASCPDCATLLDLLGGLSDVIRDDMTEAPAALAHGVMERIYAWEESHTADDDAPIELEPVPIATARTQRSYQSETEPVPISKARKSHWGRNAVAAACLLLVIGGGAYYGMSRHWQETTARNMESITLEAAADVAAPAIAAGEAPMTADGAGIQYSFAAPNDAAPDTMPEMPEPEEVAEEYGVFEEYAVEEAAPAEAEPEAESIGADKQTYAAAAYTLDHPATVPAGRESEFEALLHSPFTPDNVDESALTSIAAVEYNGVLYEFLLDAEGGQLFWKDAAESVFPLPAAGTEEDLWNILG